MKSKFVRNVCFVFAVLLMIGSAGAAENMQISIVQCAVQMMIGIGIMLIVQKQEVKR